VQGDLAGVQAYVRFMNAPFGLLRRPPEPRPARLTIAQYYAISDSGALDDFERTELLDGRIYQMNAQYTGHMRAKLALFRALDGQVSTIRLELGMEATVELGLISAPQPDLFVWTGKDEGKGAPDGTVRLAIEVADSSERQDLGRKRRIYARNGVPEYWVAVLRKQEFVRFTESDGKDYVRRDTIPFESALSSLTLQGLTVPGGTLPA
jgi:Uma2 family endonuclease